MQCRCRSISRFIVVAFILAQLAVPAVGWAQESNSSPVASPESGICGEDKTPVEKGIERITYKGDVVTSREETRLTLFNVEPDGQAIVAGWSLLCAEDKLTSVAPEQGIYLDEEGQILMDVREGSVTLEICVDTNEGCFTGGEMRLGKPNESGGFTWSEETTVTLTSPTRDVVSLSHVTVKITFDSEPTRLFASGWNYYVGSSECNGACIRFP